MEFSTELIDRLRGAEHIVIFTGAGVSQESGIPTFRDALTGLWERYDAEALATPEAFARDPELVWGWYEWRRALVLRCQPNAGHQAIAAMARFAPRLTVITQNVDDLHERAGSTNIVHLHGSLHAPRCSDCHREHELPEGAPKVAEGGERLAPPRCTHCGGMVRPGVVWFGESLPEENWLQAQQAAGNCDVLFSVGTSSAVYPAAGLPVLAAEQGACIVQVNPHDTALGDHAQFNLRGQAGVVLPRVVEAVWPEQ
jgi:NAD-dependent deacetylase